MRLSFRNQPALVSCLLAGLACLFGLDSPIRPDIQKSATAAPSNKRMAERLEQIIRSSRIEASPYMNREKAAYFRQVLSSRLDARNELKVRFRLAEELLLSGETLQAIEELKQLQDLGRLRSIQPSDGFARPVRDLLTLVYFRLGEQENCILHHSTESCLLPIRNGGIHKARRGSREAILGLTAALKESPSDLLARWLLNIAYMTLGEHPHKVPSQWLIPGSVFDSEYDIKRFPDVAGRLGLDVLGLAGGSVLEDFNADGLLDLMVSSSGLRDPLRFFQNNGDGTFTERTAQAGLTGLVGGLNMVHADYNNDGFPDVLVLRGAWMGPAGHYPNSLLRSNRDGTFTDVTEEAGLLSFHPTGTAAWGDFDNDGWVDLFVGNESQGKENHPCELYRNNGDGTFREIARELGLADLGFVKGVIWGDYNNDGLLDLYVSRLGAPNCLFRNEGKQEPKHRENSSKISWAFTDVTSQAGVAAPINSFATWFWDYDNDGWQDLFVAAFHTNKLGDIAATYLGLPNQAERSRLYRNNHDGTFSDVTRRAGLDKVLLIMGANFGDLDNDGFLDAYFGTGEPDFRALLPNRMFRNAKGSYFQDVTTSGGFGHLQKGHAISFGDIDNDGDQDIYADIGGAFPGDAFWNVLFANPGHGGSWVTLELEGARSNRAAIGTRVRIAVESERGTREVYQSVNSGGSFGASSLRLETGLGDAKAIREVEIFWPASRTTDKIPNLQLNRFYRIREGEKTAVPLVRKSFRL